MSSLAHFCNRIGIDSELLRVIKKDNKLYNKKTAEPISDWVLFNAIKNPIQDSLLFHKFRDDDNFYAEPYSNNIAITPRNIIQQKSTKETTFQRNNNRHSIIIENQPYFTNIFNKAYDGVSNYEIVYPFADFGNVSFNIDFRSEVLTLKRISTNLVNRSNLDVLDADNYSYAARLNLYHGSNQKMHFSPHYITDFSDDINRKLMVLNHALYDLWQDLSTVTGVFRLHMHSEPDVKDKLKGHYFTITDTESGLYLSFDSFFKFTVNIETSLHLAKNFIKRYNNYKDPIALHLMKMLNLNPILIESIMPQDIHAFYNDIEAFENYVTVFEMTVI